MRRLFHAVKRLFAAPLSRGEASGFCERGVLIFSKTNPPLRLRLTCLSPLWGVTGGQKKQ
jgi:hypothetical protein